MMTFCEIEIKIFKLKIICGRRGEDNQLHIDGNISIQLSDDCCNKKQFLCIEEKMLSQWMASIVLYLLEIPQCEGIGSLIYMVY